MSKIPEKTKRKQGTEEQKYAQCKTCKLKELCKVDFIVKQKPNLIKDK